ncbi:hypothetical protein [Dactylosporangium sp. CS-033363]|uniref:hypothetical protein n=1 Tax=Dactylosporangium sp. CS-033363 TaxID=3239935 RepID=UPI003D8CE6D6
MDGHWQWSEGDDADTADLGGDDGGHDLHGGFGEEYGAGYDDAGASGGYDDAHGGAGYDEHDLGEPGQHLSDGHLDGGSGDLEEPLGTEHATAEYDESVHDGGADHGGGEHGDDGQHLSDGHIDGGHDGDADPAGHDAGGDNGDDGQLHLSDGHIDGAEESHETQDGHEAAFGTDPDVDASADDPGWHEVQFPEELHLQDPPAPVDGFPWIDADVLGGPDHNLSAAFDPAVHEPAEPAGLAQYEHLDLPPGTDPWSLLLGSDDPGTSSLAAFWAPQ